MDRRDAQARRQSLVATKAKEEQEARFQQSRYESARGWLRYQEDFKHPRLLALRNKELAGKVLDQGELEFVLSKMPLTAGCC
jgi:hypothetical protein